MDTSEEPESQSARSRSPLKAKPLRSAGDSIRDLQMDLVFNRLLPWLFVFIALWVLAILEWLAVVGHWGRHPGVYTGLAAIATGMGGFQFWRTHRPLEQLRLGREGERVVGEFLDRLRASGAQVFHDIPGDDFNLDHVVFSTRGFFVIETKTRSKPKRGDARVTLTESSVLVAGWAPDRDPIRQVQAGARWLSNWLEESTGKRFPVKGVVLFPGWFVEPMSSAWRRSPELPWVLAPRGLPKFIEQEPPQIPHSDVKLATSHLSRYVRALQAERSRTA